MKRLLLAGLTLLLLCSAGRFAFERLNRLPADEMHVFPVVLGPQEASRVVEATPTPISAFERGGPHRLAILVTYPQSGWLGLSAASRRWAC